MGSSIEGSVNMRHAQQFFILSILVLTVFADDAPDQEVCQKLKHRLKGGHHLSERQTALYEMCDFSSGLTDRDSVIKRCQKLIHKDIPDIGRFQKKKIEACQAFLQFERERVVQEREAAKLNVHHDM